MMLILTERKRKVKDKVMGKFVNPDNDQFAGEVGAQIYVDKTALINYTNKVINTSDAYICNSRPRRFGKSYVANMLTAYYSRGCDSRSLFEGLDISKSEDFDRYLNKCDVIHLDIQWFFTNLSQTGNVRDIVSVISGCVIDELKEEYQDADLNGFDSLPFALAEVNDKTGRKFVVIIDEWDVLIRDEVDTSIQDSYIMFLRSLFKGKDPSKYLSLAYLTGILPIKKIKTESALNNFDEYTMLRPSVMAPYFGFTDGEVRELCDRYNRDYNRIRQWYDGYLLSGQHMYNPRSVSRVIRDGEYRSFWSDSGAYESVVPLIRQDFDGLKAAVISMLSGNHVAVKTGTFKNDMREFGSRDDVLTILIHLGYLGFDESSEEAYVPDDEVRRELENAVEETRWTEFDSFRCDSEDLLDSTLDMDSEAVAETIGRVHDTYASMIKYNDENSLSSVLTIGYLASMKYYFTPVREMPLGRGFADFVYIPRPEYLEFYPALVVELKWNGSVKTAIDQISEKKYPEPLKEYTGDILVVGINYDKKTKKHECSIEKLDR